ncbi:unnamed protein product [Cuscuta campestris]|uniref:Uncharacterized protein n=1 Tax=Cuscuta campestris TaxID=132261 RepID=A0A484LF10_9ASTE|nr:unnamed protein product [Cuscuta campestris]
MPLFGRTDSVIDLNISVDGGSFLGGSDLGIVDRVVAISVNGLNSSKDQCAPCLGARRLDTRSWQVGENQRRSSRSSGTERIPRKLR